VVHEESKMKKVFGFLASQAGRITRIVAGLVLIGLGLLLVGEWRGYVMAAVGLVPLAAGVFDVCMFAPLFGRPFLGKNLRRWAQE
jgi:uncharacterized protein (DUF697 family)